MTRVALFGLVLAAPVESDGASPPRVVIEWTTPSGCPTQESLEAAIEGYLGRAIQNAAREDLRASGIVRREAATFVLHATFEGPSGSQAREVRAERCSLVTDAMAFITAAAIDPDIGVDPPDGVVSEEADSRPAPIVFVPRPPTRSATPTVPPPEQVPRHRGPVSGAVRVDAAGSFGLLPSAAPGLQLSAALRGRRFRVEGRGGYWFARAARVQERAVARLQAWGVSGHGCVEPVVRWASFPACVGFEVGAMHGRGAQISESRRDRLPWAAVALDGAVAFTPIRRLAIVVGVGIHVPVVRPRFSIDGLGRVHEPAPVTGSVRGGLEFRFP